MRALFVLVLLFAAYFLAVNLMKFVLYHKKNRINDLRLAIRERGGVLSEGQLITESYWGIFGMIKGIKKANRIISVLKQDYSNLEDE